jgi:hypothetical protein
MSAGMETRNRPVGVLQQLLAELGQRLAARGAQQQALTQALLQGREPARHAGLGQPHLVGRTAETAQLRHAGKDEQVVRVDGCRVECA